MQQEDHFLQAYDAHSDAIFRYCYYRVYDRERAIELMQETFTKVWSRISDGYEIQNHRAFLYTTARNLIIDYSRKKKEQSLEMMQDKGFDPAHTDHATFDERLDGKRAIERMSELDDQYRDVVYMRYVEGLKPKEISEIIGETQNVVSVRIHRGLKQLKLILSKPQ